MLDHVGLYVTDIEKAKAFYIPALKPLGYAMLSEYSEWSVIGMGTGGVADLWFSQREAAHNVHIALKAESKEAVDAFYTQALEAGATDNGAPGYRTEYSPGYYGAFVTDPFGNNLEAVFHDLTPAA